MFRKSVLLVLVTAATAVSAQLAAPWAQCGGQDFTGVTECACGSVCTALNPYFSQCIPTSEEQATQTVTVTVTATPASVTITDTVTVTDTVTDTVTVAAPTSTSPASAVCSGNPQPFEFFGVNESGAEFGNGNIPGVLGTDFIWPTTTSTDFFLEKGFNTFRITFLMDRLSPPATGLTGPFDPYYLGNLTQIATHVTSKGGFALIDPHNFMRYNGSVISSVSDFQTWWTNLAAEFKDDSNIIFDLQNEPYGIDAGTVFQLEQAAVNGIRSSGATTQLILAEGTSYTGAWTWTTSSGNSDYFGGLTDPNNNIAIEMHQYLDSDGSGTNGTCVSSTIGSERIADATLWLQENNMKGFLGEFGGGSNAVCIEAVQGMLCDMQNSGGAWIGALWWAAGPWWGDYFLSIEPPDGAAIPDILPQALEPFLPIATPISSTKRM